MVGFCAATKLNGKAMIVDGRLYTSQIDDRGFLITQTFDRMDHYPTASCEISRLVESRVYSVDRPTSFSDVRVLLNGEYALESCETPVALCFKGQVSNLVGQIFTGKTGEGTITQGVEDSVYLDKQIISLDGPLDVTVVGFRNPESQEKLLTKTCDWYHLHALISLPKTQSLFVCKKTVSCVLHVLDFEVFMGDVTVGKQSSVLLPISR
jgi:hypothetical protein